MDNEVVIFGTNLFADVVYYYLTNAGNYKVVAFTANTSYIEENEKFGCPVIPYEQICEQYPPDRYKMFIAVGYAKLNTLRAKIFKEIKSIGYTCVTYVYPTIKLWDNNKIGENTFIFEDNTIQPFVEIGDNTVLWSGNHIGHHSTIGDHCFISSHVVVSGNCSIGDYSFIGVNSTIRDNIHIGKSCIIGAGSIIMKNTKDKELYIAKRTYPDKRSTDIVNL